jgi:hypothetical protein
VKAQVRYTYGFNMSGSHQDEVLEYARTDEGDEGPYVVMYTHEAWAARAVAAILNADGEGKQGDWPPRVSVDHKPDASQSYSNRVAPLHDSLFGSHDPVSGSKADTHETECLGNGNCSC